MRQIQLRDAKVRLSVLVEGAAEGEPAMITRHGKTRAVLLGIEEWNRLRSVPSFGCLLLSVPLEDGDLSPRDTSPPRGPAFWGLECIRSTQTALEIFSNTLLLQVVFRILPRAESVSVSNAGADWTETARSYAHVCGGASGRTIHHTVKGVNDGHSFSPEQLALDS